MFLSRLDFLEIFDGFDLLEGILEWFESFEMSPRESSRLFWVFERSLRAPDMLLT